MTEVNYGQISIRPLLRPPSSHRLEMPDRPAGRDHLGGGDDALGVDAVMAVEVGDRAGLAEMLDAERAGAMAA